VASSAVMVASTSELVAIATASSGVTLGGITTGIVVVVGFSVVVVTGTVVEVEVVEVVGGVVVVDVVVVVAG